MTQLLLELRLRSRNSRQSLSSKQATGRLLTDKFDGFVEILADVLLSGVGGRQSLVADALLLVVARHVGGHVQHARDAAVLPDRARSADGPGGEGKYAADAGSRTHDHRVERHKLLTQPPRKKAAAMK